jgi:DNA-binding beta-propeller fold protein YncE
MSWGRRVVSQILGGVLGLMVLPGLLGACTRQPTGLLRPNGVAVASDGSVYVMDRGNARIAHLAATGRFLNAIGHLGAGPADIYYGWDAATDAAGNIYVGNMVRSATAKIIHDGVKVFTPQGDLLREVGAQDYAAGQVSYNPYGLDLDTEGRLYVVGYKNNTLRIFGADGTVLGTFFGRKGEAAGEFNGPNDVAVDDQRGLVYVSDSVNSRVQQFSLTWPAPDQPVLTHRLTFGTYGREPGEFAYPLYLAVDDTTGQLYVGDMGNRRVQRLDPDGRYLGALTVPAGVQDWQVLGLNVGPAGQLYVADALNNAIWVFTAEGQLSARLGTP